MKDKTKELRRAAVALARVCVATAVLFADPSGLLNAAVGLTSRPKLLGVYPDKPFPLKTANNAFALFRDGSKIVSADDKTAVVWDLTTGKTILSLEHSEIVLGLALAPDEKMLLTITAGRENPVRLWNLADGKLLREYPSPMPTVTEAERLANKDKPVWNLPNDPNTWLIGRSTYSPVTGFGFTSVAFSATGREVAAGCDDGTLVLWKTETGERITKITTHEGRRLGQIVVSPDAARVLTCSARSLALWDTKNQVLLKRLLREGPLRPGNSLIFSQDGRQFTVCGIATETTYDATTGDRLRRLETRPLPKCDNYGTLIAALPDDEKVLAWDLRHSFAICDIRTGTPLSRHVYTSAFNNSSGNTCVADVRYLSGLSSVMIFEFENSEKTSDENWTTISIIPLSEFKKVP